jgi:hypothetical protein
MVFPFQLKLPVVTGEMENADSADALFIASLKVTFIWERMGTFIPVGVFPRTEGSIVYGIVVNCKVNEDSILLPTRSLAPVPTVTIKVVLNARNESGV